MTQTRLHRVGAVVEATLGTTPATPSILLFEESSASPVITAPKQTSDIIRNDARVRESVAMNRAAGYVRAQELVVPTVNQALWTEIRAGLRASAEIASTNVACTIPGGDATITRAAGSFISDDYDVGDIVQITGASASSYNAYYRIASVDSATQLTLEKGDSWAFGAPDTGTVTRGAKMIDGTTDRSFSLEECWLNLTTPSAGLQITWTGQRVGAMEFGFAMGGKSTYRATYAGVDGTPTTMDGTTAVSGHARGIAGAEYTDPSQTPILGPSQAIQVVANDITIPCRSMSLTFENGARVRHSTAGGAVPDAVPTGTFRARVTIEAYASVLTLLTQYRAATEMAVWVVMPDGAGDALGFSLGTVMWDTGTLPTPGLDQDAMISVTGNATLTEAADANDVDWVVKMARFV